MDFIHDGYELIKLTESSTLQTIRRIPGWTSLDKGQEVQKKLQNRAFSSFNFKNIQKRMKDKITKKKMILNFENWFLIEGKLYGNFE